jgi:hypothetical protein
MRIEVAAVCGSRVMGPFLTCGALLEPFASADYSDAVFSNGEGSGGRVLDIEVHSNMWAWFKTLIRQQENR